MTWEITAGFWLMMSTLYYLDGDGLLLWALLACSIHEGGHILAVRTLGGRVRRIRLTAIGAELRLAPLPPDKLFWTALAGPGSNLLTALVSAKLGRYCGERLYLFAGINLGLALFNLLPASCLDGGRVMYAALDLLGWEEAGERVTCVCSYFLAGLLCLGGTALLWQEGNFTLLFAGVWLAAMARQKVHWRRAI